MAHGKEARRAAVAGRHHLDVAPGETVAVGDVGIDPCAFHWRRFLHAEDAEIKAIMVVSRRHRRGSPWNRSDAGRGAGFEMQRDELPRFRYEGETRRIDQPR